MMFLKSQTFKSMLYRSITSKSCANTMKAKTQLFEQNKNIDISKCRSNVYKNKCLLLNLHQVSKIYAFNRMTQTIKYHFSSQDRIKNNTSRQKNIKIQELLIDSQQIELKPQNLQKLLSTYKKIIELKNQIHLNNGLIFSDFWVEFNKMMQKIIFLVIETKNYQKFIKLNWQLIEKQKDYSLNYLNFVLNLVSIYNNIAKQYYFNCNYQQSKKFANSALDTYTSIKNILQQKRIISNINSQLMFLIQLTKFFQAIDNPHKIQIAIRHMIDTFKVLILQKQFFSSEILQMLELTNNKINVLFRTLLTFQNRYQYVNQINQILEKIQQLIPNQKNAYTFQILSQMGDFYLLFKDIARYTNLVNKINQYNCQNDLEQVIVYRMNSKFLDNFKPIQQHVYIAQKYILKALNMNENSHFNHNDYQLYILNSMIISSFSFSVPPKQKQKYLLKAYEYIKRPNYKQVNQQLYYRNKAKIQLELVNLYVFFQDQFIITPQKIQNLLSSSKQQIQKFDKQQVEYQFTKVKLHFNFLIFLMNIIPIKMQNRQQIILNTRQYFRGCILYPEVYKPFHILEIFKLIKPQNYSNEMELIVDQIQRIYAKQFPREFEQIVLKPHNEQSQDKYCVNSQGQIVKIQQKK